MICRGVRNCPASPCEPSTYNKDEQSDFDPCRFQIVDYLGLVFGSNRLHCFQLNDHLTLDEQVSIELANDAVSKTYVNRLLALFIPFVGHAANWLS